MSSKEKLQLTIKLSLWILSVSIAYAILRYNIGKGIAWEHFPIYVLNKAVAITSAYLLSMSVAGPYLSRIKFKLIQRIGESRTSLGLAGAYLMGIHILMSLISLHPNMYNKFFALDGTLSFIGELSMVLGVLAAAAFLYLTITSLSKHIEQLDGTVKIAFGKISIWGLVLLFGHTVVMGYQGWGDFAHWPLGLPPISLLSAMGISKGIMMGLIKK